MNPPLQRPSVVDRVVLAIQEPDPYLSLGALSDYASISVRQLRNLIADPVRPLPCYRIGRRVIVKRSDYDQWAAQYRRVGVDLEERVVRLRAREKRKRLGASRGAVPHSVSAR